MHREELWRLYNLKGQPYLTGFASLRTVKGQQRKMTDTLSTLETCDQGRKREVMATIESLAASFHHKFVKDSPRENSTSNHLQSRVAGDSDTE